MNRDILIEIESVDWEQFEGSPFYSASEVPVALREVVSLNHEHDAERIKNMVLNSVGNNHEGIYYPVVLKALDFLIRIQKETTSKICKICVLGVLNDLYYFQPCVGDYKECSANELKNYVLNILQPFNDENTPLNDLSSV